MHITIVQHTQYSTQYSTHSTTHTVQHTQYSTHSTVHTVQHIQYSACKHTTTVINACSLFTSFTSILGAFGDSPDQGRDEGEHQPSLAQNLPFFPPMLGLLRYTLTLCLYVSQSTVCTNIRTYSCVHAACTLYVYLCTCTYSHMYVRTYICTCVRMLHPLICMYILYT